MAALSFLHLRRRTGVAIVLPTVAALTAAVLSGPAPSAMAGPTDGPGTTSSRTLEGTVERVVVDPPHPGGARASKSAASRSDVVVSVRGPQGRVQIPDALAGRLRTGQQVRVTTTVDVQRAERAGTERLDALVRDGAARVTAVEALAPPNTINVRGTHRMAVVPVTFGTSRPWTTDPQTIRNAVKPTDDYWNRVTNGRIRVDYAHATVSAPLAATRPRACDDWDGIYAINYAARARLGATLRDTQYDHLVLLLPAMDGCWGGLGDLGGFSPYSTTIWLNNDTSARVLAHELGHNLGLNHNGAYRCYGTDGQSFATLSTRCTQVTYEDPYALMGGSYVELGTITATHMDQLGLLTANGVQTAQNVLRRQYTLRRLTAATTEDTLRGLVLPAPRGQLLVEYRTAAGQDAWLTSGYDTAPGVIIRGTGLGAAPGEDPLEEDILRPSPDWNRSSWQPGETLTGFGGKAVVSVVSAGAESAVVQVTQDLLAPTPGYAPTMLVRSGPVSDASLPATVMWGTASDGAGVGVKNLLMAPSPGGPPRVLSPTETRFPVRMPLGKAGSVGLRLNDVVGNTRVVPTASVTPRIDPLSSWTTGWSSGWTPVSSPSSYYGGLERQSAKAGSSYTATVTARSVGLVATKGRTRGKVAVYVDGALVSTVDLGSPTPLYQNVVWTKSWPRTETHTVRFVNLGTAGRPLVGLDALATLG